MPKVAYYKGATIADAQEGQTLLDISIRHRIPHFHQCGGRGRCTTCRVQILDGISKVSPRNALEERVSEKRGWDEFTRLACQTKVHGDVLVRLLIDNPQDIIVLDVDELHGLGPGEGKEVDVAILFSDVRNFTTFAEANLPYDVVHLLNRHFTAVTEPVLNNNGFVDKYIGDGILAVFGTRNEAPATTCRNAVRAALLMQDAVARLGPEFENTFGMKLRIGVGVHYGTVILGRLGHPGKRQVTIIGDAVNLASRIEGMTKELDAPVLLSDSVVAHLQGALAIRPVAETQLKGREARSTLYACHGFTPSDTIFLAQKSFAQVVERAKDFGGRFYEILFEMYPEYRSLFREDISIQNKMLFSMLSSVVRGLNRLPEITGGLRELGKRHKEYDVNPADYDKVARALLRTLEEFLGDEFTVDVHQAWVSIYGEIAAIMTENLGE